MGIVVKNIDLDLKKPSLHEGIGGLRGVSCSGPKLNASKSGSEQSEASTWVTKNTNGIPLVFLFCIIHPVEVDISGD